MTSASRTPRHPGRSLPVALAAACAAALWACDGRRDASSRPLATLVLMHGAAVSRDFAARREQWQPAQLRAQFRLGDGLRSQAPSTAVLALVDGSKLQVQPDTTIRFLPAGAGEQSIDVSTGEALLLAGAREVNLRTHVGLARVTAGGRVRLARTGDALDLRVEVGEARFRNAQGQDVRLARGDDARLLVGMAVLRAPSAAQPEADGAQASALAPADAGAGADAAQAEAGEDGASDDQTLGGGAEPGPDYTNLAARAGESFVVHAPEVPVAVASSSRPTSASARACSSSRAASSARAAPARPTCCSRPARAATRCAA